MELLDRYLDAVKKHLPWERQDDILAELRANLEAQLEDKEVALGRPLNPVEAEAWIKQLGQPLQVAASYRPQRYLIGPALFPTYWYVLRLVFFWSLVAYGVASAALIASGTFSGQRVLDAVMHVPMFLITIAAWVTLGFVVIEFAVAHGKLKLPTMVVPSASWEPGIISPVGKRSRCGKKPRTRAHAVAHLIACYLGLIWLLLIPHYPFLIWGPGAAWLLVSLFKLAPVWWTFYWWVIGLNVLQVGYHSAVLANGSWQKPRPMLHLAKKVLDLIPTALLLVGAPDGIYVTLKNPAQNAAHYGATVAPLNKGIHMFAIFVLVMLMLEITRKAGMMGVEAYRKRKTAMQ